MIRAKERRKKKLTKEIIMKYINLRLCYAASRWNSLNTKELEKWKQSNQATVDRPNKWNGGVSYIERDGLTKAATSKYQNIKWHAVL